MPKSLCSHELFIRCHCCFSIIVWADRLSTYMIIDVSYLTQKLTYTPSLAFPKISSLWPIFLKWWPCLLFSLCDSPANIVKHRAFNFGTIMHLYWSYIHWKIKHKKKPMLVSFLFQFSPFALFVFTGTVCFEIHHNDLIVHIVLICHIYWLNIPNDIFFNHLTHSWQIACIYYLLIKTA